MNGSELWKSDGTSAGTVLVKDIRPGALFSRPQNLTNSNGTLFFSAEAERRLDDVEWSGPAVFLFGRESVGFAPEIRERYRDQLVRLPMRDDRVRSLNVSTCVGIVLYEAQRRLTSL